MNIESKFGLKDSLATAVILAVMLVFILAGVVARADARTGITAVAGDKHAAAVQQMEPIIVSAQRMAVERMDTIVVTAPRQLPLAGVADVAKVTRISSETSL